MVHRTYMSPEQARASKGCNYRSRCVWPWRSALRNTRGHAVRRRHVAGDDSAGPRSRAAPTFTLEYEVDRDLEVICLKCLEKEPSRRYARPSLWPTILDRWLITNPSKRAEHDFRARTKWVRRRPAIATLVAGLTWAVTRHGCVTWQWQARATSKSRVAEKAVTELEATATRTRGEQRQYSDGKGQHSMQLSMSPRWLWLSLLGSAVTPTIPRATLGHYIPGMGGLICAASNGITLNALCQPSDVFTFPPGSDPPGSIRFSYGLFAGRPIGRGRQINGKSVSWISPRAGSWRIASRRPGECIPLPFLRMASNSFHLHGD